MRIVLPYPPSANAMWRSVVIGGRVRVLLSREGRAYKADAGKAIVEAYDVSPFSPLKGEVALTVRLYRPALRGDIDNRLKPLLDVLNGWAWMDDKQVARIDVSRELDRENPRVEVEVESVSATPVSGREVAERMAESRLARRARIKAERDPFAGRENGLWPEMDARKDETPVERVKRLATPNVRRKP